MTLADFIGQRSGSGSGDDRTLAAWRRGNTLRDAWVTSKSPRVMLWVLGQLGFNDRKRMILYACWCMRRQWDRLDARGQNAVFVAEAYAAGDADASDLAVAHEAAVAARREHMTDSLQGAAPYLVSIRDELTPAVFMLHIQYVVSGAANHLLGDALSSARASQVDRLVDVVPVSEFVTLLRANNIDEE